MAAGRIIRNNFKEFTDELTGTKVTRLTEPDHVSHHMYFYNRMTTADGSRLLYCAELEGERQMYLMDLHTGDAVQLTEGDGLEDYGGLISAEDTHIFYQQKNLEALSGNPGKGMRLPHPGGLERRQLGDEPGQPFYGDCGNLEVFPSGEEERGQLGLFRFDL